MHALHPHLLPRRALAAALAAVLALALTALLPSTIEDLSLRTGTADRGAAAPAPAPPDWRDNPLTWPLLQAPPGR